MFQAVQRWLQKAPIRDPVERQLAPLFQIMLLVLLLAIVIAIALSFIIARDGTRGLTPSAFIPVGLLVLAIGGALLLIRRGHFRVALWVILTVLLLNQARSVFTTNLYINGISLLSFVIPITIAGLLIGRRALLIVTAVIFIIVLAVPLLLPLTGSVNVQPPSNSLNNTIISFLFVTSLFVLIIYAAGNTFRSALAASVQRASELAEVSEQLRVTLTSIGDAVIATDTGGFVTLINEVAQEITGWTQEQALGQALTTVFRIVNEETRATVENPVDKVMRLGTVVGLANHTILIAKDGRETPIDDSGAPIRDASGLISGVVLVFRDITERKIAETRTNLLQQVTTALSEAVTPKQVASVILEKGFRELGVSGGSVGVLSEDHTMIEGLVHYGYPEAVTNEYQQVAVNAPNRPLPEAVRTQQPVWIKTASEYTAKYPEIAKVFQAATKTQAVAALPLIVEKRVIGGIIVTFPHARDFEPDEQAFMQALTEQAAQALDRARLYAIEHRARMEAEEANRLKLQFLAMISHELRTPLTSIKGFATTLLSEDITWDAAQQREFVGIIDQESDKLTELVEQLLDLSRLQVGALSIAPRAESSSTIMEGAKPELEALTANHQLTVNIAPDLPPVMADGQRITQVITNLVNNAAKYSAPKTPIIINVHQQGDLIQFDVHDEGIGIPDQDRALVFEAFRQVERKGEGQLTKGAGLGLAICKGIVETHGGSIWIQDRVESGTTISFTLPIASGTPPSA